MKKVLVWETSESVFGGQKMTLTIMDLLKEDYEFCCLIPESGKMAQELEEREIPYILIGDQTLPTGVKGIGAYFRYAWISARSILRSLKEIFRFRPDILYAPGPAALPWSAVCGALTHRPVIWHLHHVFLDRSTQKLLNYFAKWQAVQKIIAVSNSVGAQIKNSADSKVEVLYNPVDFQKYSDGDEKKSRKEFGAFTEGKFVVGQIALIQRSKKQDVTLRTLSELRRRGVDAVGIFLGECRDPEFKWEIDRIIQNLNLEKNVLFAGRRADVPDVLKVIDILLIPSFEGFPLVGLEAAAAGVPIVACDIAGAKEFIEVSGGGRLFPEDDYSAAVDEILAVWRDAEIYRSKGKVFAKCKSPQIYAAQIKEVFGQIRE